MFNCKKILVVTLIMSFVGCQGALGSMTNTTAREPLFTGDGSTVAFVFNFPIDTGSSGSHADLEVHLITTATGVAAQRTETTHYTVTATNNNFTSGGTVTMVTAPASTEQLLIKRTTAQTQTASIGASGVLKTIETSLDKLTRETIDQQEELDRTPSFPVTDPASSFGNWPNNKLRAGLLAGFDETTGAPTAVELAAGTFTVSAFAKTYLDDTTAAATMATLQGIPVFNVMNPAYGATGLGTGDDGAAVQAIVDSVANSATGGAEIFFPPGAYRFATTVIVQTPGIKFTGSHNSDSGTNATNLATIVNATGSNAISGSNAAGSSAFRSLTIQNLNFRTEANTGAAMIKIVGGLWHSLRDLGIWGIDSGDDNTAVKYTGYAIELDQVQQVEVERVFMKYYSEAAFYPIEIKNTSVTELRTGNIAVRDVQMLTCYNGFKIDGPRSNNNIILENCKVVSPSGHTFVGNVGKALVVGTEGRTPANADVGGVVNLTVRNCEFENKNDGCIELQNCEQVTIEDSWLHCDTVPAVKIEGNVRGVNYRPNYITYADNILDMDSTNGPIENVVIDKQVLNKQRRAIITVVDYTTATTGDIISLTVNNIQYDLVEGTDWDAATSNNITAASILDAVEGMADIDDTATTVTDNAVTAAYIEAVSDNSSAITSAIQNFQIPTETINITEVSPIDYRRTWLAGTEIIESIVCFQGAVVAYENEVVTYTD